MSSTRSFTVKIRGREITENVISDATTAIYRANVDALTDFHSRVEDEFIVAVTINELNTFLFAPKKIGTKTMDLILQRKTPYAKTYHLYDRDHPDFFSEEENEYFDIYIDKYNEKRFEYTDLIPDFRRYLEEQHARRVRGWGLNGFLQYNTDTGEAEDTSIDRSANRRNTPGSRVSGMYANRRSGGNSKKHRKTKKHRKSNKRK
jgi:hypothetical protein